MLFIIYTIKNFKYNLFKFIEGNCEWIKEWKWNISGSDNYNIINNNNNNVGFGHIVRDVAPNKVMVCLSFFLPSQVGLAASPII